MFGFSVTKKVTLQRRIKVLEAECDRLCQEVADLRQERDRLILLSNKQARVDRRRIAKEKKKEGIKKFIGYRNLHNVVPQFWPKVLCPNCGNCKQPKNGKGAHYCTMFRFQCGKYGTCKQAFPRLVNLEEEKAG